MLARNPWCVVTVAFAVVLPGAGCSSSSEPAASCGTPTPEQCKDADWLSSDPCGVKQREAMRADPGAFCNHVVVEASQAATEDLVPETVVDPETGATAEAKVLPNAAHGPSDLLMPQTAVGLDQQAAIGATSSGLSAAEQALRGQWDANGNRVASCREYVYEKYFEAARFEDAIAARHDDSPYVYDVAFGPVTATTSIGARVIAGQRLKMRDGYDMTVQAIAARPRHAIPDCTPSYGPPGSEYFLSNIFFAIPRAVFDGRVRAQVDPATAMAVDYGRCYERVPDPEPATSAADSWEWHRGRRAALLAKGITLAEMAARHGDVKAFQQALVEYEQPEPACCLESRSMPCCWDYLTITRPSIEARLAELFLKAYAAGCLGAGPTACDWSPGYFVESLRATFGGAKETDYQRCLEQTRDDFVALAHKEFPMPWGPWQTWMDYTQSVHMVEQYYADLAMWRAAYHASLPPEVKDPDGSLRPPASERSAHHEAGNALFGAYYEYLLAWSSPGLGLRTGSATLPCVRDLAARGSFTAGAWVFGSGRTEVLDAAFGAGLLTGVGGHLSVLDVQIWGQDQSPGQWTIVSSAFDVSKPLVQKTRTFTVAYIPITVAGGLSGTLHLEREVTLPVRSTLGDGCYDAVTLRARFNPWVRLEAFASAAVGTAVASAGIECALTLLRLETPYDLAVALALDGATGKLELRPSARGDLVVRTLDGRISLFVRVDVGLFDVGYSYDVFRWSGLRAQLPLFRTSYTLPLDDFVRFMSTAGP